MTSDGAHDQGADDDGIEAVRADIERDREELARTIDELGRRLDVKTRASERLESAKAASREQWHALQQRGVEQVAEARSSLTTAQGRPTPQAWAVGAAGAVLVVGIVVVVTRRGGRR